MGHQKMKAVHVNGQDVAVRLGRQRTTSTTVVMGRYTENTEPLSDILKKPMPTSDNGLVPYLTQTNRDQDI